MQMLLEMQTKEKKIKKAQHERQESFLFSGNFFKLKKYKNKKPAKRVGKNLFTAGCKEEGSHLQLSKFHLLKHYSKFCLLRHSPKWNRPYEYLHSTILTEQAPRACQIKEIHIF